MTNDNTCSFTGVDVGTNRIVCCQPNAGENVISADLNAFIALPPTPSIKASLRQRSVPCLTAPDSLLVYGRWTSTFAELFHAEMRRPMKSGCLNPQEPMAIEVISKICEKLAGEAETKPATLVFAVPSAGVDAEDVPTTADLTNHESMLRAVFQKLGYQAYAVKEGEALIYSELADTQYSGVGISFGAGLCNVAMTYLSVPVLDFSVPLGGEFIDSSTATVLGEKASRVRVAKESGFGLSNENRDLMNKTLQVFYLELIQTVVDKLSEAFGNSKAVPRLDEPIPMVLGGGTAMPKGFAGAFERALRSSDLPIQFSDVRMAKDPLNATAIGALQYAKSNFSE